MAFKASLTDRIKAFNTGTMNVTKRNLTKKEMEEKKKLEEEQETAKVFEDFVASFNDKGNSAAKASFVRGAIINSDSTGVKELKNSKQGSLYMPEPKKPPSSKRSSAQKPQSNLEEIKREIEQRMIASKSVSSSSSSNSNSARSRKKEETSKRKSNLEAFKEELKQMHEAREEHGKIKQQIRTIEEKMKTKSGTTLTSHEQKILSLKSQIAATEEIANTDVSDPNSTNLYCSNIHTDLLEEHLCKLFGRYGPLASVKIMYPRSDEEKSTRRNTNCGFVAFMCRKDAENALVNLSGIEYKGVTMSVAWGRVVAIPPHPIYIPKRLRKLLMPPPPTKQPFNALHPDIRLPSTAEKDNAAKELWEKHLEESCVKVCIPTDRNLLHLIHRMVEFVVREGPMFEALIMNRELNNPLFRFLFDNPSPAHLYYRWKLFSVLQGDDLQNWRTEPFRMFKTGPLWKPPPVNVYTQGMPVEDEAEDPDEDDFGMMNSGLFVKAGSRNRKRLSLSPDDSSNRDSKRGIDEIFAMAEKKESGKLNRQRGFLSSKDRATLDDILVDLSCSRESIESTMLFCLTNAECAEQIVRIIVGNMQHTQQHPRRLALLFLFNDLLHNSSAKVFNAASYRRFIEPNLCKIFSFLNASYSGLEGKFKQDQFKQKVMNCFRAWEQWAVYPEYLLIKLQNIFLGLEKYIDGKDHWANLPDDDNADDDNELNCAKHDDADGVPFDPNPNLDEVDLDLDMLQENENLDGIPLSKDDLVSDIPSSASYVKSSDDESDMISCLQKNELKRDGGQISSAVPPKSKWQQFDDVAEEEPETDTLRPSTTLSKWETVDDSEDDSEFQSGTTKSKSYDFQHKSKSIGDEDIDGIPMDDASNAFDDSGTSRPIITTDSGSNNTNHSQSVKSSSEKNNGVEITASQILDTLKLSESEKRTRLRDIEVKVMKYQDELESGKHRSKKTNMSVQKLLEQYRVSLAKKERSKLDQDSWNESSDAREEKEKDHQNQYERVSSGEEIQEHPSISSTVHKSSAGGGSKKQSKKRQKQQRYRSASKSSNTSSIDFILTDPNAETTSSTYAPSSHKHSKKSSKKSKSDKSRKRSSRSISRSPPPAQTTGSERKKMKRASRSNSSDRSSPSEVSLRSRGSHKQQWNK